MKINNLENVVNHITNWLTDQVKNSGTKGFTLGVSGGIDSAVTSTLCAMTGYPVILVEMPIHQSDDQVSRAQNHINWLRNKYDNVSELRLDLTDTYDSFIKTLDPINIDNQNEDQKMLTLSNTRSRLRMVSLYAVSGVNKLLVCGTGNKVEDFGIGFYTKYGDGGVDISPIADLMKSEVYNIGRFLEINEDILNARPTDGLWDDGRTDEDQIGATYDELEWAMDFIKDNWFWEQGMENAGFLDYDFDTNKSIVYTEDINLSDREKIVLNIYLERHNVNKHKMVDIPVCKIPNL